MSDKEFVLDVIQRMPKSVSLTQIRERVDFLAAVKAGKPDRNPDEGVPQTKVRSKHICLSNQRKAVRQAAGLWKNRKNLPDFAKLRQEWERK